MSFDSVVSRLAELRGNLGPDSIKLKTAMIRIGSVLSSQMKINAPIRTGNLRNRINYVYRKLGDGAELQVGSFATPYAAMVEFGFYGIQSVREHTRKNKNGSRSTVRHYARTINRQPHRSGSDFGYIRPALNKHAEFIIDQVRSLAVPR